MMSGLFLAGTVAGCSSSATTATTATTVPVSGTDPPFTVGTLCDAWRRLPALGPVTAGTYPDRMSSVAESVAVLRAVSQELAAHPPPSVATPVRHYAAVIGDVADALAQRAATGDTSVRELSRADSQVLSHYVVAHCAGTAPSTTS